MSKADWLVKGVKTFEGREGIGFNASLYWKGKRVAKVTDDASGGPSWIDWLEQSASEPRAALEAFCAAQPRVKTAWDDPGDEGLKYDAESFVDDLVNEYQQNQQVKRWCKTKVLFRMPDDPEGEYRTFKTPFTADIVDRIHRDYGTAAIIENFRFGSPK